MSPLEWFLLLLIAAICGATGQAIVGNSTGGCLVSILVGIIGAYFGLWLARELQLPLILAIKIGGQPFPIVWAIIGSALFAGILSFAGRSRR